MNERRIQRLQEQIKARVAEILLRELQDPKLGIVTITRVELDKEFTICRVFWSVLGDDKGRARSGGALQRARGFVQREVGRTLNTRTVPRLEFRFDAGIAGAIKLQQVMDDLRHEREARAGGVPPVDPAADAPPDAPPDASAHPAPDGEKPGGA